MFAYYTKRSLFLIYSWPLVVSASGQFRASLIPWCSFLAYLVRVSNLSCTYLTQSSIHHPPHTVWAVLTTSTAPGRGGHRFSYADARELESRIEGLRHVRDGLWAELAICQKLTTATAAEGTEQQVGASRLSLAESESRAPAVNAYTNLDTVYISGHYGRYSSPNTIA